jgi:site-specific DNA recombinase
MANKTTAADDKKAKRIAIYTRKSNDDNLATNVTSLDAQKSCCRSYISIQRGNNWEEIPEVFDDPAESGRSLKRPAMQRLLKRVEEGAIDGVIVYKLDRLTRNSRDFHYLLELFENHNVAFISATESIDTKSPQGRLMTAIMVQFAQYDREMDQERSKDFHLARAKKGLWCGGISPLGYDSKEKLLVVNEKEADLVRRIFEYYVKSQSAIRVAQDLNRLGCHRKLWKNKEGKMFGGQPFDMDSIIRILQRKVYIGIIKNGRTGQEFPGQQKPIIAPDVFEKVQKMLVGHNHRGGEIHYATNKYGFLLKGLVRCGECGSPVSPMIRPKRKKIYKYYKCLAQDKGLPVGCSIKSIGAKKLEEFVIEKMAALGWDRPFLEKVVRIATKKATESLTPLEKERCQMLEQIEDIRKQSKQLVNTVKAGGDSLEIAEEIRSLENSKKDLEVRVAGIEAQVSHRKQVVYDLDVVQGVFKRFALFIHRLPVELQVQIIKLMVERVTIGKGNITVKLYELPVAVLKKSLDKKGVCFGGYRQGERQGPNTTGNAKTAKSPQSGTGTAVVELEAKWRLRRDRIKTDFDDFQPGLSGFPAKSAPKAPYIPAFDLSWQVMWVPIRNGERVIYEIPPGYKIKSQPA